jgi:hypothetical protein
MKAGGLWTDFLRDQLGQDGRDELARIARTCLDRSRSAG